ncbi:MAG: hypothetical protein JW969_12760 [Spirochaetales bacterium]|nr:hypothetical protein [Spirochaetales bacterium]
MKALVFIPGYKGSFLKNNKGDFIWATLSSYLKGNIPAQLDLFKKPAPETIIPDGVFDKFPMIKNLFSLKIYSPILNYLAKKIKNAVLFPFSYDWRLDILPNLTRLHGLFQDLRSRGFHTIDCVSHSLGSYMLAYYLRYGIQQPENPEETWEGASSLNNIVFSGAPFKGSLVAIRDTHLDERSLFNRVLLTKNTVRSFPIAYQLLPSDAGGKVLFNGKSIDLFSPDAWETHSLGFFKEAFNQEKAGFTRKNLLRAKLIQESINRPPGVTPPDNNRILNIIGTGIKTPYTYVIDGNQLIMDETKALNADGDDTIVINSAQLPPAYGSIRNSVIQVRSTHMKLLYHKTSLRSISEFFRKD